MNILAKIILGYENAFACAPGICNRIYVNKEWLSELTKEEKEFLFAHELMHIKHKDAFLQMPVALLEKWINKRFPPFINNNQGVQHNNAQENNGNAQEVDLEVRFRQHNAIVRQNLLRYAIHCAATTFENTVKRSCEKHADIDAVKLLKTGKGGVQLMRTLRNFKIQGPWYRKAHAIRNKICYPILSLPVLKKIYLKYPAYEDRMNYIAAEDFEQEQKITQDNSANNSTDTITESSCAI